MQTQKKDKDEKEHRYHLLSPDVGVAGNLEIEVVGEQGIELQSEQSALCEYGSMLLLYAEEMLVGIMVGEHHGLAA